MCLLNTNLLFITVKANGTTVEALADSGASITLVNRALLNGRGNFRGKLVEVQAYDGQKSSYNEWTTVEVEYEGHKA